MAFYFHIRFSSFLIWLSAGKYLLSGGERRRWIYPTFRSEFGGHGLLLCFLNALRESAFNLFAGPLGKTAASTPRGSTHKPGYIFEPKLVWFGVLNTVAVVFLSTGRLSSKGFSDTLLIWCGDRRTGRGCLILVFRFVYWLLIYVDSGYTFLYC